MFELGGPKHEVAIQVGFDNEGTNEGNGQNGKQKDKEPPLEEEDEKNE